MRLLPFSSFTNHPWLPLPPGPHRSLTSWLSLPTTPLPRHTVSAAVPPLCSLFLLPEMFCSLAVWRTPIHAIRPSSHVTCLWCPLTQPGRLCGSLNCALPELYIRTYSCRFSLSRPRPLRLGTQSGLRGGPALVGAPSSGGASHTGTHTASALRDRHRGERKQDCCPRLVEKVSIRRRPHPSGVQGGLGPADQRQEGQVLRKAEACSHVLCHCLFG